jgi:putative ABC transport system substrate-binding protein
MRRREFVFGVNAALMVGVCLPCQAQQRAKSKIGYLTAGSKNRTITQQNLKAFLQSLESLGYVEGQNVAIEVRFAELDFGQLPGLASELVELKVDVIVAAPTPAAVAAKKATTSTPIVMINVADPIGRGLVDSLARPGGNITGLAFSVGLEHYNKAMELLKEAVPAVRKIGVLTNPGNPAHPAIAEQITKSAGRLNLDVQIFKVSGAAEIEPAFVAMTQGRFEAVFVVSDTLSASESTQIATLVATHRLPSMHQLGEEVEAGGLMSYGPNSVDQYRRAAAYVDKILKGAKPADLPVQQPTKFDLVINLRTARALGLTIAPALLVLADQVIE